MLDGDPTDPADQSTDPTDPTDPTDSDPDAFRYPYGLARVDRVWLRRAAAELRARLRRTVAEVVSAGRVLARARRRLGRGLWEPWLAREAGVPRRSASRLVAVHRAFGTAPRDTLQHFTPTALYALAEPGVPQSLREYAVAEATAGREVTAGMVGEWLSSHRDRGPLSAGEVARLASKDPPKEEATVDPARVFAADNWLALAALIEPDNTLHLARTADAENGDAVVTGVLIRPGGRPVRAAGATLEKVVLALSGGGRGKACKKCGEEKPLDLFSVCKTSVADGRNKYCRACEATRVRDYERRKAAERVLAKRGETPTAA